MKFSLGVQKNTVTFPLTACRCRFNRRKRSVSAMPMTEMKTSMKFHENVAAASAIVAKAAHACE